MPFTFARQCLTFVPLFLYAFTPFAAKSELVIFFHLPLRWRTVCQSIYRSVCRNFLAVCRGCCGRGIIYCWKTVCIPNHINISFQGVHTLLRLHWQTIGRCLGEPFAAALANRLPLHWRTVCRCIRDVVCR